VNAESYVNRVSFELRDLPWGMRRELVSELRGHLEELPDGTDLGARLGTPAQYAADLRAAAGLERRRGVVAFLRARRLRNVIVTVVALTLVGLAIGAVVWIDSYQPIAFAGGTQLPLDAKPSLGQAGESVVFRKGHPFQYGVTIQNTGRFTVRVLGVPKSVADFYAGRLLMSESTTGYPSERPLVRFHPFDLEPGEIRWLLVKGVYACTTGMGRGVSSIRVALQIRFSFLWRSATPLIPLGDPLTVTFPKGCPPPRASTATP
jgi:hypothetical protein